ncbi:MAG: polyprenyl synthetase family protein [Thermoplasmata archaeon]|nr:polyprenyl synthetase family protein [Thermoplasmata archaeon]
MKFSDLTADLPALERSIGESYRGSRRAAMPVFRPYLDLLNEFTLRGGKRFRALLVLGGYRIASAGPVSAVLPAAAALEHFQSWMLVHDDIIDHSEERRGGPTLHRLVEARHRAAGLLGRSEEYGVGVGITLGDLQEPFTIEGLLSCPVPAARRLDALREYIRMTRETAYGQLLDIQNGATPVDRVRESDVLTVHRLKSAVYTVASPLRIGAILGGGNAGLQSDLESFGIDIGVAFQLRDDILGTGFEATEAGKSANDLVEGKRTLLVVRAWADAGTRGREALAAVLGRPEATPDSVEEARRVIRDTGSLRYSESRIEQLTKRALARVDRSPRLRRGDREFLHDVADRLVHRNR